MDRQNGGLGGGDPSAPSRFARSSMAKWVAMPIRVSDSHSPIKKMPFRESGKLCAGGARNRTDKNHSRSFGTFSGKKKLALLLRRFRLDPTLFQQIHAGGGGRGAGSLGAAGWKECWLGAGGRGPLEVFHHYPMIGAQKAYMSLEHGWKHTQGGGSICKVHLPIVSQVWVAVWESCLTGSWHPSLRTKLTSLNDGIWEGGWAKKKSPNE